MESDLVVYDAAGNNPITILTFPNDVSTGTAGSRILITSASFASYEATPITSDFTMTMRSPPATSRPGVSRFKIAGLHLLVGELGRSGLHGAEHRQNGK